MNDHPVVLITGASSGIGRATAQLLAQNGCRVFGTSRSPAKTRAIPGVTFLALDVHSPQSVQECVQAVLDQAGRIDALVNNAGLIGPGGASEETSLDQVRALFDTNFFGVVQVTNAVLPVMRQQRSGTIINISSAGGQVSAPPFFSFYAASKHAIEGYSEGLRYEVRPFNIQVAMIQPGYTSTEIGDSITPPDHPVADYVETRQRMLMIDRAGIRYGTPPGEVARTVLKILGQSRPALRNPVGSDGRAILLLKRFMPHPLFERLIEWMYLTWQPKCVTGDIPSPAELGLHRFLFHRPTRDLTLRAAAAALFAAAGLGALAVLLHPSRKR